MSERELALISKELIETLQKISASQIDTYKTMLRVITKILIACVLIVFMIGACLFYCIYSIYNYDSYPSIPSIENTNITGNSNQLETKGVDD